MSTINLSKLASLLKAKAGIAESPPTLAKMAAYFQEVDEAIDRFQKGSSGSQDSVAKVEQKIKAFQMAIADALKKVDAKKQQAQFEQLNALDSWLQGAKVWYRECVGLLLARHEALDKESKKNWDIAIAQIESLHAASRERFLEAGKLATAWRSSARPDLHLKLKSRVIDHIAAIAEAATTSERTVLNGSGVGLSKVATSQQELEKFLGRAVPVTCDLDGQNAAHRSIQQMRAWETACRKLDREMHT